MSIPHLGPGRFTRLSPIAHEIDEGVLLCEFLVRMRLKNRIVNDALTAGVGVRSRRSWLAFLRDDLGRLARESAANGRRAGLLRNQVAGSDGLGTSMHDYHHLDAGHLDRRYVVGKVVARRLRRRSRRGRHLTLLLQQSCLAAEEEIRHAARVRGLDQADAQLIEARADRLRDLGSAVGPIRLKPPDPPRAS